MTVFIFVFLISICAAGQSAIPSFEPERLASYLKKIQTEEEGCEHGSKKCEAFYVDDSITKGLGTSLVHLILAPLIDEKKNCVTPIHWITSSIKGYSARSDQQTRAPVGTGLAG